MTQPALTRFGVEYARHRAEEGRHYAGNELLDLPYIRHGPLARQWSVRARSFDALLRSAVRPLAAQLGRTLSLLDLGAGNGWLSYRVALEGHRAVALDIRDDTIDGLGAAAAYVDLLPERIKCIVGSFEAVPLESASVDVAVFNASLHYTLNLDAALAEAARVTRTGGRLVIMDSPFYQREEDGISMVQEKIAQAAHRFGDRADVLLGLPFIEFLTAERLRIATEALGLRWHRHRVFYPLWYEFRPYIAAIRGHRRPSRFDLWMCTRP